MNELLHGSPTAARNGESFAGGEYDEDAALFTLNSHNVSSIDDAIAMETEEMLPGQFRFVKFQGAGHEHPLAILPGEPRIIGL